jgi:hypothetical protein
MIIRFHDRFHDIYDRKAAIGVERKIGHKIRWAFDLNANLTDNRMRKRTAVKGRSSRAILRTNYQTILCTNFRGLQFNFSIFLIFFQKQL